MNALRQLREMKGMSQEALSEAIPISRESICRYENGTRNPSLVVLKRIANYFDVSIDFLLMNQDGTCK